MGIYFIWGVHNYGISGSTWGLGLTRTRTETTQNVVKCKRKTQ